MLRFIMVSTCSSTLWHLLCAPVLLLLLQQQDIVIDGQLLTARLRTLDLPHVYTCGLMLLAMPARPGDGVSLATCWLHVFLP